MQRMKLLDLKDAFWWKQTRWSSLNSNNLLDIILNYVLNKEIKISNQNLAACFEWLALYFWTDWRLIKVEAGHEWIVNFIQKHWYPSTSNFRVYIWSRNKLFTDCQNELDLYIKFLETTSLRNPDRMKLMVEFALHERPWDSIQRIVTASSKQWINPLDIADGEYLKRLILQHLGLE